MGNKQTNWEVHRRDRNCINNQTNSGPEEYNKWNKNAIGIFNIRLNQAESRICKLQDRSWYYLLIGEKEIGMQRSGESLCELWDTI